jgi:hypothetical protein
VAAPEPASPPPVAGASAVASEAVLASSLDDEPLAASSLDCEPELDPEPEPDAALLDEPEPPVVASESSPVDEEPVDDEPLDSPAIEPLPVVPLVPPFPRSVVPAPLHAETIAALQAINSAIRENAITLA